MQRSHAVLKRRECAPLLVSCGEALVDFLPAGFGAELGYVPRAGGAPFNLSVALSRLAVPSAFLGCVADDAFGDMLVNTLRHNGVDDRYVVRRSAPSTLAFVSLAGIGSPEFAFFNRGAADTLLVPRDLPPVFSDDVSALCFGSLSLIVEPAGSTLLGLMQREAGKRCIVLDPNIRLHAQPEREPYIQRLEQAIACADIVKASRRDIAGLYPDADYAAVVKHWLSLGPQLVVVTLQEAGAALFRADGLQLTDEGMAIALVDSVGAGDSFLAAFLSVLRRHGALQPAALMTLASGVLQETLHFANRAAAIACSRSGGADPPRLFDLTG